MSENPSESLLGVNIGTSSSIIGVLARPDSEAVATSKQPHELSLPHAGWAEQDAEEVWWKDFVATCAEPLEKADGSIAAVSQRHRTVLFGRWRDRDTTWICMADTVEPNPENRESHDELHAVYRDLYSATRS
jgi:glycerol kinase